MTIVRARVAAGIAAIGLVLALVVAVPGSASSGTAVSYLALGDSVAYGWDIVTQSVTSPPDSHVGYPEVLAQRSPLVVTNAACPGETSASFLQAAAPDNGCDFAQVVAGLKTDWGAGTQVEFAEAFLVGNPDTGLVSLQLGANDLILCQQADDDDGDGVPECTPQEVGQVLAVIAGNLAVSLARLRATGYDGPIVLMGYYATDYRDPAQVAVVEAFGGVLGAIAASGAFGDVAVADVLAAFEQASRDSDGDLCADGLRIPRGDGTCDFHPTPYGDRVLAQSLRRAVDLGAVVSGWNTDR